MARTLLTNSEIIKTVGNNTGYEFTTEIIEGDYDIANNTSPVTTNLYCQGLYGYYYTDWHSPYATISYNSTEKKRNNVENTSTSKILICSHTEDIQHENDGTKKITITTAYNNGGASAYYIPKNYSFTASDIELSTIPRNSTFASQTMTYNFSDGNISVPITKNISNATDTLTIKYENTTLFSSDNYISNTQLSPIASAVTTIANDNLTNQTCTLVATLKTYVDGIQIGSTQTMNITASFINDLVINSFTCIDTNTKTVNLTGDNTLIVGGISNLQATINYTSQFGGAFKNVIVGSSTYTTNPFTMNEYSVDIIMPYINSNRDFTYTYKVELGNKFIDYSRPFYTASVARTSQTGDTISATLNGTWFNGNIGSTSNTISAFYRSKLSTSSTYGNWNPITLITNGNTFSGTFTASGFTYTNQYDVQIAICDAYYDNKELYLTKRIMKSTPIYDVGENDVHFRCNVEVDGTLTGTASGNAPISHSSSATTYGVGTESNYGHCKIVNNITTSTAVDGEVLGAAQGKILRDRMDTRFNYSTSAKTAGAYDNKTLYRKIIKETLTLTANSEQTIAHGISNITSIRYITTLYKLSWVTDEWVNDGYLSSAGIVVRINKTNIIVQTGSNAWSGDYVFTIEYTTT